MTDDVRKLLGGYATGSLSAEEREQLFRASLEDPELFAALADEHALKDLLDDPAARAQLLRATEQADFSLGGVLREWFDRPRAKVLVAVGALAFTAIGVRAVLERGVAPAGAPESAAVSEMRPPVQTPAPAPPPARAAAPEQAPPLMAQKRMPTGGTGAAAEPTLAAPAAPPPPPPAPIAEVAKPNAEQVVRQGDLEVRYAVLRQGPNGEYVEAAADAEFRPGEPVKLRLTANQPGAVMLVGTQSRGASVRAGEAAEFAIPALPEGGQIELAFASIDPLTTAPSLAPQSARSMRLREEAADMAKTAPAPPPAIRIQIRLRVGEGK